MSPILLRPVREQLEHDRVIRLLQAKYKRKFEVVINPGNEQAAPITVGQLPYYPDLVLQAPRGRKLVGVVEVETTESVNNLEAMSQWAAFSRLRAPFHLYVPATSIDSAKRLCADLQITVAELWAYNALGDQMRFTLMQRSSRAVEEKARAAAPARAGASPARRPPAGRSRVSRPATPRRAATHGSARRKAPKTSGTRVAGARKNTRPSRAQKRR